MNEANATAAILQSSFRFQISDISNLKEIWSPEILVQGVPWKICFEQTNDSLAIYLYCAESNKTVNWSHAAAATVKLIPFDEHLEPHKHHIKPYVFDSLGLGFGCAEFMKWDHLFDVDKKYVQNDKINLDIKIEAESPNDENRSILTRTNFNSSCNDGCSVTFQLTVTNVNELLAVKSPEFMMRNITWNLMIYKNLATNTLCARIQNKNSENDISCKAKMHVKLVSMKKEVQPIEKSDEKYFKNSQWLHMPIISLNELLGPEKGFINNNSIVLEIEIRTDKPEGVVENDKKAKPNSKYERQKLECPICFEIINDQDISSVECGHLFCSVCIKNLLDTRKTCPSCDSPININNLRRVFLPFVNQTGE